MLRVTVEGTTFPDFDDAKMPVSEGIALRKVSGLTPKTLWDGVEEFDPEAIKALVWLVRRRAEGEDAPRYSALEFDLGQFDMASLDEQGRVLTIDPKTKRVTHVDGEPVPQEESEPDPTAATPPTI